MVIDRRFGLAPRLLFAVVLSIILVIADGKDSTANLGGTPTEAVLPPTNCPLEGRGGDPGLSIQKNRRPSLPALLQNENV